MAHETAADPDDSAGGRGQRARTRIVAGVLALLLGLSAIGGGFFLSFRDPGGGDAGAASEITIDVPAGWADRTEELAGITPDVQPAKVFVGPTTGGYPSLMNVVHRPRDEGNPPLAEMAGLARDNIRDTLTADVGEQRGMTVGGQDAFAYDYTYESSGVPLKGRQIVTYHGADVLFLNFNAHRDAFDRDVAALDEVVASLRW